MYQIKFYIRIACKITAFLHFKKKIYSTHFGAIRTEKMDPLEKNMDFICGLYFYQKKARLGVLDNAF